MDQLYGGIPLDTIGHSYDNGEDDDETQKYSDTIDVLVAATTAGMRPIPRQQISIHGSHFHRLGNPSSYFDVFLVTLMSNLENWSLFSEQGLSNKSIPGPMGTLVAVKRPKKPTQVGLNLQSVTEPIESDEGYTSMFDRPVKTPKPWVATLKSIQLEIQILSHRPIRDCQNIVTLLGFGWEKEPVVPFICLEYATFGALDEYIQEVTLPPGEKLELCVQVSLGLYVLHRSGVIHGDLKPRNILIFKSPPQAQRAWIAKISDFGSSIVLGHDLNKTDFKYSGTAAWNAPETFISKKIPRELLGSCDVFSFALIIISVFSNGKWSLVTENPSLNWKDFWTKEPIQDTLKTIQDSACKNYIPESLQPVVGPVIRECLQAEPLQRCNIEFPYESLSGSGKPQVPIAQLFKPNKAEFRMSARFVPWECQEIIVKGLQKVAANESNSDHALALLSLSNCYLYGFGLPHDMSKSIEFLTRSAERGNHTAKVLCEIHPQFRHKEEVKDICPTCQDDINNEAVSHNLLRWFRTIYPPQFKDFIRNALSPSLGCLDLESDVTAVLNTLMTSEDINKTYGPVEYTMLHVAVVFGRCLDVQRALELGADLNIPSKNKVSPISSAIQLGRSDVVELLLQKGADCSGVDVWGYSPLHSVFMLPCHDILPLGAKIIEQGGFRVLNQVAQSFPRGSETWLFRFWGTPLHCSIVAACKKGVELLAPHQPNATAFGWTALEQATSNHLASITNCLLEAGAHPRSGVGGRSAFHLVGDFDSQRIFHRFLLHGSAMKECASSVVNAYLAHDHDIDVPGQAGVTALMDALSKPACANNVVEALLECGADPNHKKSFILPLSWAVGATGCVTYDEDLGFQRVRMLLEYGADINGRSPHDNDTALHAAAIWDLSKICSILIKKGANLEIQADYPSQKALYSSDVKLFAAFDVTPLHLAAQNNSTEAVKVLLDNGASIDAETREHRTPLSIALRLHHREVAEILINRGAEIRIRDRSLLMNVMMAWGFERDSFLRNTKFKIKLEDYKRTEDGPGRSQGSLLTAAVWRANPESVKFVLNQGWDFDTQLYELAEDEVLMFNSPELGKALEALMNPENGGTRADIDLEDFLEVLLPAGTYTPLQIAHTLLDHPQDMTILRSQGEMRHYRARMLEIISLLDKAGCPAEVTGGSSNGKAASFTQITGPDSNEDAGCDAQDIEMDAAHSTTPPAQVTELSLNDAIAPPKRKFHRRLRDLITRR